MPSPPPPSLKHAPASCPPSPLLPSSAHLLVRHAFPQRRVVAQHAVHLLLLNGQVALGTQIAALQQVVVDAQPLLPRLGGIAHLVQPLLKAARVLIKVNLSLHGGGEGLMEVHAFQSSRTHSSYMH